nr:MAG TPA: hypothetical protein [Caudoviricetes sp.]
MLEMFNEKYLFIIHLKLNFFNFSYIYKYFLSYKTILCWLLVGYNKKEGVFSSKKWYNKNKKRSLI